MFPTLNCSSFLPYGPILSAFCGISWVFVAMIQMQTNLDVADNTGARSVMCIKVLGGSKRRYATVGDIIKVTVKDAAPAAVSRRAKSMTQS